MLTTNELLQKKGENIRRMFSSIATRYDFLNALLSLTFDRRWRRFAVSVSGLKEGDKVLDVCTGTGDLAIEYAKAAKSRESGVRSRESKLKTQDPRPWTHDSYVVGTDFCDEMLKLAVHKSRLRGQKSRIGSRDLPPLLSPPSQGGDRGGVELKTQDLKLRFVQADTLHLPFPNGSFQISAVAFGIRNVTDVKMGIREMARVVSPGGRVVILEFAEPENKVFRWFYDFYFYKILPVIGRLISTSKIDAYAYLPSSVQTFPDKWHLKALMKSCGLEDVKIYPRTFGIVNIFVGKKPCES